MGRLLTPHLKAPSRRGSLRPHLGFLYLLVKTAVAQIGVDFRILQPRKFEVVVLRPSVFR